MTRAETTLEVRDPVSRFVLVLLWNSDWPVPIMRLEDCIPSSLAAPQVVVGRLDELSRIGLIATHTDHQDTNGATLVELTENGRRTAARVFSEETKNGFPVVQRMVAHLLWERWDTIRNEWSADEVARLVTMKGDTLIRLVRDAEATG